MTARTTVLITYLPLVQLCMQQAGLAQKLEKSTAQVQQLEEQLVAVQSDLADVTEGKEVAEEQAEALTVTTWKIHPALQIAMRPHWHISGLCLVGLIDGGHGDIPAHAQSPYP